MERKHRNQMTSTEIKYVEALVHAITEWDLATEHAEERMREKNVSKSDVVSTLRYGAVIEVKNNGRVLMRARATNGKMKDTCVVVDINARAVVTVWRNFGADNHKTLIQSEYTWTADIVTFMRTQCRANA